MLAGRGPRSIATGRRVQPRERGPREHEPLCGPGSRPCVAWLSGRGPRGHVAAGRGSLSYCHGPASRLLTVTTAHAAKLNLATPIPHKAYHIGCRVFSTLRLRKS